VGPQSGAIGRRMGTARCQGKLLAPSQEACCYAQQPADQASDLVLLIMIRVNQLAQPGIPGPPRSYHQGAVAIWHSRRWADAY
jgi:hypothetical protein